MVILPIVAPPRKYFLYMYATACANRILSYVFDNTSLVDSVCTKSARFSPKREEIVRGDLRTIYARIRK